MVIYIFYDQRLGWKPLVLRVTGYSINPPKNIYYSIKSYKIRHGKFKMNFSRPFFPQIDFYINLVFLEKHSRFGSPTVCLVIYMTPLGSIIAVVFDCITAERPVSGWASFLLPVTMSVFLFNDWVSTPKMSISSVISARRDKIFDIRDGWRIVRNIA